MVVLIGHYQANFSQRPSGTIQKTLFFPFFLFFSSFTATQVERGNEFDLDELLVRMGKANFIDLNIDYR